MAGIPRRQPAVVVGDIDDDRHAVMELSNHGVGLAGDYAGDYKEFPRSMAVFAWKRNGKVLHRSVTESCAMICATGRAAISGAGPHR